VVNDWYITAYEPIFDESKKVIGALYVGIPEQRAVALKTAIKSIKIGKTGYAFIMDSSGRLVVHPAKEGETILEAKDSTGFEYIKEMIRLAPQLRETEVGTLRYPGPMWSWGVRPRMKINKYLYFGLGLDHRGGQLRRGNL
jgi:methyl-accepting chemotaxis protein-2 (aspartate sensor receptor)